MTKAMPRISGMLLDQQSCSQDQVRSVFPHPDPTCSGTRPRSRKRAKGKQLFGSQTAAEKGSILLSLWRLTFPFPISRI